MHKAAYKRKTTHIHGEYNSAVLCHTGIILLNSEECVCKIFRSRMLMNKRITNYSVYFPSNK